MAKLVILGREFDIAPYRLGAMMEVAPFIDSQKQRQADIESRCAVSLDPLDAPDVRAQKIAEITKATTMVEMMENFRDAVSILHVGVARVDPAVTVQMMLDDTDPTPASMASILATMRELMGASGLQPGEALAPAAPAVAGA